LEQTKAQLTQNKRDISLAWEEEVGAVDELLSRSAQEVDSWKTRFGELQTEFKLARANWEEELVALQGRSNE